MNNPESYPGVVLRHREADSQTTTIVSVKGEG